MGRRTDLTSELTTGLRDRAEDLRPAVRRTEIGALSILRDVLGVLLIVPRLVVRLLGTVADAVDTTAARGEDLAERGRQAIDALPEARSTRRQRRMRGAAWVVGGFAAGFVTGWLVAQRQAEELVYDLPPAVGVADDATSDDVTSDDPVSTEPASGDGAAERTTSNGGRRRAATASD